MSSIAKQSGKKAAFTIVELLTVMSIIVILISLLVPSLTAVKRYARKVRQGAQFHGIGAAMELFHGEEDGYPPSSDPDTDYCGAMKLAEAMVGQDLLGFHPKSLFNSDLTDSQGNLLYDKDPDSTADDLDISDPDDRRNLQSRKGPYLPLEKANAYRLRDLYGENTDPWDEDRFVLCDEYARVVNKETGKKIGMPILYYKADPSGMMHDPNFPDHPLNFYDYEDNHEFLDQLDIPWDPTYLLPYPLVRDLGGGQEGQRFYEMTKNPAIRMGNDTGRPYRPDSYILISAGFDGLYGTEDDVLNFKK
jgi:type II secretory pathway pseudopilin PulG